MRIYWYFLLCVLIYCMIYCGGSDVCKWFLLFFVLKYDLYVCVVFYLLFLVDINYCFFFVYVIRVDIN